MSTTDIGRGRAKAGKLPRGSRTYAVPAVEKSFDVLELLATKPSGLTISEIASELQRSVGELYRIVVAMERRGYVVRSEVGERYLVAYKLLDLAYRATPVQHLTQTALPLMQLLTRRIEQSCHLVIASEGKGLVVVREDTPRPMGFSVKLGAIVDLVQSCSGHVLLAFSDRDRQQQLLDDHYEATGRATDTQLLAAEIDEICAQGYAQMQSRVTHGVTDISFPVRGFDGKVVAALTVPFLKLIGPQQIGVDEAREQLSLTAAAITAGLGWRDRPTGERGRPPRDAKPRLEGDDQTA